MELPGHSIERNMIPYRRLLVLVLVGLIGPGCAAIRVRPSERPLFPSWQDSALTGASLSPRTQQTLRQHDLEIVYRRSPAEASARLHAEALDAPRPDLLFALAEINYRRGRNAEGHGSPEAICLYYLSAGYAYHYLFDSPGGVPLNPYDPRTRLACDLYNAGLGKCIAAAQRAGELDAAGQLRIPTSDGHDFRFTIDHVGFTWQKEEFGELLLCDEYEVVGLANHHRTYGLGVPLIANRRPTAPKPAHTYYPLSVSFPVTAFFRFEGSLAQLGEMRAGRLELYNPLAIQTVTVAERKVPLETDLTTPLAYFLAGARLDRYGYEAFLYPDILGQKAGIHTLEPYQRGKIPVVFVHGLFSSPLTWAPVYNDLQADPILRKHFQFWAFFYPTGNPYLATAADLRQGIERLRHDLDPDGIDPALQEIVCVGHSMGGLVSRLLTVEGGDDFWGLVSHAPLEQLKLNPQTRGELQAVFYFEPISSVRRVIFMGTPHHGSRLSPSVVGRIGTRLAGLPDTIKSAVHDVDVENPQTEDIKRIPTSVDLLDPKAPALELLASRPRRPGVHYHSVIGIIPPNQRVVERYLGGLLHQPSDGVVPYSSAHIDDAESELVVPADHYNVHHHPLAILEVRRILLEHLREVDSRLHPKRESEIVPVGKTEP
jgi:pimeloyl-ACP methyl ester carboxylesterase